MAGSPTYIRLADKPTLIAVEIPDLAAFEQKLGEGVLAAFCRCFVHADRLTSLAHFRALLEHCPSDSVAVTRDYYTMAWFSLGTLREYAKELRHLKSACANAGLLDTTWEEWQSLFAFEKRWDGDGKLVSLRSQIAFHVDPDDKLIPAGLGSMHGRPVALFMSDKPSIIDERFGSWYRLGMESLLDGHGVAREDFVEVFKKVAADMSINTSLYDLFRRILDTRGIKLTKQAEQTDFEPVLLWRVLWAMVTRPFRRIWIRIHLRVIDETLALRREKFVADAPTADDRTDPFGVREGSDHLQSPRSRALALERSRLIKKIYRQGEVEGVRLERLLRRDAIRHGVATFPSQKEGEEPIYTLSPITGQPRLNANGVAIVRDQIRLEARSRREPWLTWLAAVGGLGVLLSILKWLLDLVSKGGIESWPWPL